ncbi:MAG: 1-deoxy-D-xylulose-5-phosphate reductoisomerase [Acidobacteria bacterium]|nr:1-deoxy-D-xylulose-5-phosphate reductoisomerase [Acidobacteriota bacterium]
MKNVAILGSTGSIGRSALDVVRAHPDRLRIVGLAAGENADRFVEQALEFRPKVVGMATERALQSITGAYRAEQAAAGAAGLVAVATHPEVDVVICASSGTAGLEAVLAAIEAGKTIALANKEVLVMAGALVTAAARRRGVPILPIDSEHNAIHQCLHARQREEILRIILTASGGPFRTLPAAALADVKPAAALQHPTWRMGRKITIDSATLMNKGLEVIEARWLFDLPADRIDVVIHPQSIVHSMVELRDGSIIAQLGGADMKLPIQYACSYPDRWAAPVARLDLTAVGALEFQAPDVERFPCLRLAYRALEAGPSHAVVLNAANEVAVASYLDEKISFTAIPLVIERAMDAHGGCAVEGLAEIRELDRWARRYSQELARGLELKV